MSNLWNSGTKISSSFFIQNNERYNDGKAVQNITWLLSRPYPAKSLDQI
jgi:hypothetical protein